MHFSVCVASVAHTFLFARKGVLKIMSDYKDLYYKLFNRITDIIEELKELQVQAEEKYINSEQDEKTEKHKDNYLVLNGKQ